MKKKLYIKPEICVFQFDTQTAILNMSSLEFAKDDDYTEENIKAFDLIRAVKVNNDMLYIEKVAKKED